MQVTAAAFPYSSVAVGNVAVAPVELVAAYVRSDVLLNVGGIVPGLTVTENEVWVALSPARFTALQPTVVTPIGNVEPDINPPVDAQVTAPDPSAKSVAVGVVHDSTAPAELVAVAVMPVGVPTITGAASFIVTVNVVDAVFSYGSVAVQVTVVVPIANVEPDVGEQDTGTDAPYSSVAVGAVYVSVEPAEVAAATGSI